MQMAVEIGYDEDYRLLLTGIDCDCGSLHNQPTQDIYVGNRLLENVPRYLERRGIGGQGVLVADNLTWDLAGQKLMSILEQAGFAVTPCVIHRADEMEPDERACGEVLLTMQAETEFLISVGSGSITDTTRIVAMRTGKRFVCVGTAPSMDGYTSVVAPLLLRGVKIHRAAVCPEIIVCDLEIMRSAPLKMVISGVGDVLGKYIAHVDWRIGQIINGETYCPVCGAIVTDAVNRLIDNIEAIRQRSEAGIRILIEALLLAGVTIMIIGHTRAVASIEHNIVHYWDMMKLLDQQKQPSHGTAVGVSTLLVWPLYLRFARENLGELDLEDIKRRRMSRAQREKWLLDSYQEVAATEIMRENQGDFLDWPEQERRIRTAQQRFDDLADAIAHLPALDRIQKAMQVLGAPMLPGDIGIGPSLLNRSMYAAKDYRTRYSLFKLLDECGLLQQYLSEYPL